jgi:Transmembrane amino acid transporter protein
MHPRSPAARLLLLQVLSILVRGGFAVSLLGSFALLMHPLRTCLVELLWRRRLAAAGPGPSAAAAAAAITNKYYVPLTYGILLAAVATAVLVPDIWAALSVVGDLASTIQAFVVPGLIGLALVAGRGLAPGSGPKSGGGSSSSDSNSGQALQRVIAAGVLVLGVALFGNGVLQRVMA